MYCAGRNIVSAIAMAAGVFAAAPVLADDSDPFDQDNRYVVNKLVSDLSPEPPNPADPVLQNSWGVAFSPAGSPFWIADNDTGCSTLYDGTGEKQKLQVSIPLEKAK